MSNNTEQKPLDLDAIEAIAKAATPGEWHWVNAESDLPRQPGEYRASLRTVEQYQTKSGFTLPKFIIDADEIRDENMDANADFIAAANPSVVLRIIDIARHAKLLADNLRIAQGLAAANVSSVTINPGDVLVIRMAESEHPTTHDQFAELSRNLENHFPEGTPVLLTNDIDISALDEEAMRQAGWVKTCNSTGKLLEEFSVEQWWVNELDSAVENGTDNQKRAVAVVRNLLRQIDRQNLNP